MPWSPPGTGCSRSTRAKSLASGSANFPTALEAFDELAAADALELLGKAPDPDSAARLSRPRIEAALRRARRHGVPDKAVALQTTLRAPG